MELSIFDIIKKPLITSKSVLLFQKTGRVTFKVNNHANKLMVKDAVERIWNVKVAEVNMMKVGGKNKVFARRRFVTPDWKKAIVTLKKGYKIDLTSMFEGMGSHAGSEVNQSEHKD